MLLGIVFHAVAAVCYAILGLSMWRRLARSGSVDHAGKLARSCLLGALVLHAAGLYASIIDHQFLYIGWALALSAAIWLGMVIFWVESLMISIDGMQLLLMPTATFGALLGAIFPQGEPVPLANDPWLPLHLIVALSAYALITVAALHAILMALLDRRLHDMQAAPQQPEGRRLISLVLDSIPSLLVLETVLFRIIGIGFVFLTLAVFSGSATSLSLTGTWLPLNNKTLFTLLSWVIFGGLLLGRRIRGWRGRVALRWTMTGFAFLLLSYTGTQFVLQVLLHQG